MNKKALVGGCAMQMNFFISKNEIFQKYNIKREM